MEAKFSVGDKVKIVGYGHPIWFPKDSCMKPDWLVIEEDENGACYDMLPDIVGREGAISKITITQGRSFYAIEGIKSKHSWYYENQLEAV